ncbi:hypothetical protein KI387_010244, partial [Taxus chinensis]
QRERYGDAKEALLCGLRVDPSRQQFLTSTNEWCWDWRIPVIGLDELECRELMILTALSLKVFYDPVTTCGHSFCRSCIFQSMDR